RALHPKEAAVAADDPLHRRQPQPAARGFRREERIENPRFDFLAHPAARIDHLDPRPLALRQRGRAVRRHFSLTLHMRAARRVTDPSTLPSASDAFLIRFMITCCICAALPYTMNGSEVSSVRSMARLEIDTRSRSIISRIRCEMLTGSSTAAP